MRYQFEVDPPKLYVHDDVLIVCIEEGESFKAQFEVSEASSNKPYEYDHIISKEDGSTVNKHCIYTTNNTLWFMKVKRKDSGMYVISPSNQRWTGQQKIQLDIRCELVNILGTDYSSKDLQKGGRYLI